MKENKKAEQKPKKFNLKTFGKIVYWVVIAFLVTVALMVVSSAFNIPGGYKLFTVQSGSMEPVIKIGSVVVIQPKEDYQRKDIITFKTEEATTTHRIVEIRQKDNKIIYITKGDANDSVDSKLVNKDLVLGKVVLAIPFLGYPVSFAKTMEGLIVLVIIPAVIIIYDELRKIKKEIVKMKSKEK